MQTDKENMLNKHADTMCQTFVDNACFQWSADLFIMTTNLLYKFAVKTIVMYKDHKG